MELITTAQGLHSALSNLAQQRSIGFVPTMGALHDGHLALMAQARRENEVVVVSIFVNPTQFNDPKDLESYPRTLTEDLQKVESVGVDWVYAPEVSDIYPEADTRLFDFAPLDRVMEGSARKGHFNGVGQVVSRLFERVNPTRAYFGEKDFQQLAIIRKMVADLGSSVQIVGCPIVRGEDGLALSSRNALLSREHREAAPAIYQALQSAAKRSGEATVAQLREQVKSEIESSPLLKVEYFEIVDAATLQSVSNWGEQPLRGCVAVQAGEVRLIDNIDMTPKI